VKVILFGASGMVGQGVLRECLLDPEVAQVVAIGRGSSGTVHAKLKEIVHKDLHNFDSIEDELTGFGACFFCLGVSAAGMSEQDYRRITYDITLAAAGTLVRLNPGMTFVYISGAGADSSERGGMMWARVKGQTENALLKLPFRAAYMFRAGYIQPLHGIRAKTEWYRVLYGIMGPLYPVWKTIFPKYVTTTEQVGRAMINAAKRGAPEVFLDNEAINRLARSGS
jgi:uncharacterized protein YbjT (DUF2867 family)